jgi:threonine dehydrogenase-like Zn-dependent dehydrogenase
VNEPLPGVAGPAARGAASAGTLPATQHAIQYVGKGMLVHNRAKPVPTPGPTQLLLEVEAVGICFSDTKLLHAFSSHLRKAEVLEGLDPVALAEIPSYVPGELPTVPGHEVAGRIVAVGAAVRHHRLGERVLVQTDYRHLPTPGSNAAFGYNFEGGLQEYVLLDERMILEPGTGERFLIPVGEEPSGSAVALPEPWACVEASYATRERSTLTPGGRLLVVADAGHSVEGLVPLIVAATPASLVTLLADGGQRDAVGAALRAVGTAPPSPAHAEDAGALDGTTFDDIVYFGADADRIEWLETLLAPRGVIDIVLGGDAVGRPVSVDVGRIHYDLTRWVGTPGASAADGYAIAPADGELRAGDRVAVIGAAGPMGFMHVVRTVSSGLEGLAMTAIDIDASRLAHLAGIAGPIADARGVAAEFLDSRVTRPHPGFSYIAVMVPAPPLVAQAVDLAGEDCRVNIFAGFAAGTRAALDLDGVIRRRVYLFGTSGSEIPDMQAVLRKLERGDLDTNISVDAVAGMEGVADALAAVEARTSGGKIVVYPRLHETGMLRLSEMASAFPAAAAALRDGRWTRGAEAALLASAGAIDAAVEPSGSDAAIEAGGR